MTNSIKYSAVWWAPDGSRRFKSIKHVGTLSYYGDCNSTLEIYHEPSQGLVFISYEKYDVIWGESSDGQKFTLFKVVLIHQENFSKAMYNVDFILVGAHIRFMDEPCFETCVSAFPYLKNWASSQRIYEETQNNIESFHLDTGAREHLTSVKIEEEVFTYIWEQLTYQRTRFSISAEQKTHFSIEVEGKASLQKYLDIISEFSQFLSIALFSPQYPSEVKFPKKIVLLFKKQPSIGPKYFPLIKYNELKDRIPAMLKEWHDKYKQIAPIASYLIRSMHYDTPFDAPDFLIIAQALDGYFKRFVNKKDGKDTQKYKDGIDKLLNRFKDVEILKKCKIDTEILTQSRDKYSHLIPDDENSVSKAVSGEDLYWLTQKCKILLTCCILDMLGLTTKEINLCCNQSPLESIINSLPLEP